MRYLLWILKIAIFAFMLTLAIKNTDPVAVRYFLGHEWRAPLIFVMLVVFCAGAAFGLLGTLGQILRQRREISSLRRALQSQPPASGESPPLHERTADYRASINA
jgi:uncharacterized integral membrane protein